MSHFFARSSLVALTALLLAMSIIPTYAADEASAPALNLRVMSFNLRFASNQPPNAWPDRRPVMKTTIKDVDPDVIGTQEGVYAQLRDLAADLPAYEWIGLGRAGGSRDEFCAIFFKRDRFEPVAFDHLWLSDTPKVIGSITWDHTYIRMATWVRLREKSSGREFLIWNTHFDHQVEVARQKSAALLRDRLAMVDPSTPLLLVGDFNCPAGTSEAFKILTKDSGLVDTWTTAGTRTNEKFNTFHNYQPPLMDGERIDWILARRPVAVKSASIITYREGAQFPSDHFPIVADLRF